MTDRTRLLAVMLLLPSFAAGAQEPPAAPAAEQPAAEQPAAEQPAVVEPAVRTGSPARPAMDRLELDPTTITGNRELPKVMVIVPWKRSDLGELQGRPANSLLNEILSPVDRDVFRRELRYYDALEAESAPESDPAGDPVVPPAVQPET